MNNSQKELIEDLIVKKMKKYRRPQVRLHRLQETIEKQASEVGYINLEYPEFYNEFRDIFVETCVTKKLIPKKEFEIVETGFLDKKQRYPYDIYKIKTLKVVRPKATVNSRTRSK